MEQTQGIIQKIFYVHVSTAITMYFGFVISFLSALMYLLEKRRHWDEISVAGAEVGFFLCTLVLLTGPVWAKPVWGAWWTWEPRLTSTLLLWLLYAGYLVLRAYFGSSAQGRKVTAILAVIAFLDVPLVHFSVRLWRGIHPTVMGPSGGGMSPKMQFVFVVTFIATLFLFASLMRARFRLERSRNLLESLELKQTESS